MGAMNGTPDYTGAWLAMTLGVEPLEIDRRRRAGELLGVPTRPGEDYRYPAWQFDRAGRPLPVVADVLAAARQAGLDATQLDALLARREGMTGSTRLVDALRAGREEHVLAAIRSAS
jgi:hypothetical protein